jgi:hypothetical protein
MALSVRRKSARAGSEQKRNTSPREDIRHREDRLTTQIYVEDFRLQYRAARGLWLVDGSDTASGADR